MSEFEIAVVIVSEGELYEMLEAISGGKLSTVRLPVRRPLDIKVVSCDDAHPPFPKDEYEEWQRVSYLDGSHIWKLVSEAEDAEWERTGRIMRGEISCFNCKHKDTNTRDEPCLSCNGYKNWKVEKP